MLGVVLHAPRGPFYRPKEARSRCEQFWKAILAFCRRAHQTVRCTPDSVRCPIPFLNWRSRPLQIWEPMAHRTCPVHTGQSGAPFRPLAWPRVARRIRGRPLARPTVGSPDSPVNFSRTPRSFSREQLVHRRPAWRTGHYPVHHRTVRCARPSWSLLHIANSFSKPFLTVSST